MFYVLSFKFYRSCNRGLSYDMCYVVCIVSSVTRIRQRSFTRFAL